MTNSPTLDDRIRAEIEDSFDEEFELEIDDERLSELVEGRDGERAADEIDRKLYFKTLFDLQSELVKL